ncbi:MAG: HEAT repeat domain-containing protein [Deltaproteobacteria bacterium]|nr:HEAT repeat domain-containing protein [Deltaproteobacteria bacterium]
MSLFACSKPPSLNIERVVIDAPRSWDKKNYQQQVRHDIKNILSQDRNTKLAINQNLKNAYILQLEIRQGLNIKSTEKEQSTLMQLSLRPLNEGLSYETTAVLLKNNETITGILESFKEAWEIITKQRQLDTQKDETLIALLDDPDPRLRDFVIIRLGDRKSSQAVLPLCQHLNSEPKPELVLRTIGTLVTIGDQRAVEPLIELTAHRDPAFVMQLLYAIGSLGGHNAEAFLITVASGHPIEALRQSAEQALKEMKRPSSNK